jgi:hypothetical protein
MWKYPIGHLRSTRLAMREAANHLWWHSRISLTSARSFCGAGLGGILYALAMDCVRARIVAHIVCISPCVVVEKIRGTASSGQSLCGWMGFRTGDLSAPTNKNTTQVNLRRCLCYCLAAHCEWAQYLITLQPILHVTRAHLLQFPDGAACRFRKAPRLKAPNRLVCAHR